jgi:large subunit ribosomal protein L25
MHEKAPVLIATRRERIGSRYAQRHRDRGELPAIVYGHKQTPVPVAINAHDALGHIHKGEKVFHIRVDGEDESQFVLLKDVQFDYLGNNIIHCDFARVNLAERVHAHATLRLVGDPVGLKHAGAILMHPTDEIDIECPVQDLPEAIEVDITEMDLGHSITVGDIKMPAESIKLLTDPSTIVAQVVMQRAVEVVEAEEEVVEAGEGGEPEVLTEKKDEEGSGGKS